MEHEHTSDEATTKLTCIVYSTAPNLSEARRLAQTLVSERLVACVNLFPGIESHYVWEEKPTCEEEVALVMKTTNEALAAVTERILALHPYSCPAVVGVPILGGNTDFLSWIASRVAPSQP